MSHWRKQLGLCFGIAALALALCTGADGQPADKKAPRESGATKEGDAKKDRESKKGDDARQDSQPKSANDARQAHGKKDAGVKGAAGGKNAKKTEQKQRSAEEQEAAALALVREQHPELGELLEQLKADNSQQYRQAILELYRDSQKLSQAKEKDPERYELELKAWRIDSRVRLLAAKLTMENRPELEESLKASLLEREDVRIDLLSLERRRAAERLEKLDSQLAKLRDRREKLSNQAFDQLMRRIKSRPKPKRNP